MRTAKTVRSGRTYLTCTAGRATTEQIARVTRGGFAKEVRRRRRADSPVGKTGRSAPEAKVCASAARGVSLTKLEGLFAGFVLMILSGLLRIWGLAFRDLSIGTLRLCGLLVPLDIGTLRYLPCSFNQVQVALQSCPMRERSAP